MSDGDGAALRRRLQHRHGEAAIQTWTLVVALAVLVGGWLAPVILA